MPVPNVINDGDWSLQNIELIDLTFPFESRGDGATWEATVIITQDKKAYSPLSLGSIMLVPGINQRGYLLSQGSPQDIGSGLFRISRVYGSLPNTRIEASTIALTIPVIGKTKQDTNLSVESFTQTYPADVYYEYFLSKPAVKRTFHIYTLFGVIYDAPGDAFSPPTTGSAGTSGAWSRKGKGTVIANNSTSSKASSGTATGTILAQDTEVGIYKGPFYYRKSIYANVPSTGVYPGQ